METQKPLLKDKDGEEVDVNMYRLMVGSLMYLTSSRPDIMFAVCAFARYQVNPKVSHLHAVKRIFSMVKNLDNLSGKFLMYPRFVQLFVKQKVEGMPTHKRKYDVPCHTKKIFGNMKKVGKGFYGNVTPLFPIMVVQNQAQMGEDKAVRKELGDSLVRAATTASSLGAEQDSVLDLEMTKTSQQSRIVSLEKSVKKLERRKRSRSHGLKRLYKGGLTARIESSDEDLDVEMIDKEQTAAVNVVKGVNVSEVVEEVVEAINTAKLIVDAAQVSAAGDIVSDASAAKTISAAPTITAATTVEEITLAQALEKVKSTKPKAKEVVIQKREQGISTRTTQTPQQTHGKGKAIMIETEKPLKKKDQIKLNEETALRLQAEFDDEERLAKEEAEKIEKANIALIETWDDIQVKIDTDYQLAKRLQAEEQEELSVEERDKLFQQLLDTRRKHFAAKRAEEKRNKPPTKAQQRKIMCNYLKNMEGHKLKDLKLKDFDVIQKMFDRAFKRGNTFDDFRSELLEGEGKGEEKEKRA
ncbi:hypothetical protein Tco_0992805 [Tanacetum coccineum]|uniref:Uncharacterized protein n=1 Tax=Tanacetum coccineum TaxID=301880 RepID=A0ABQ5F348_9ASTR